MSSELSDIENKDQDAEYIVVDASVLPDVFVKILEVKKILASKSAASLSCACKEVGISRSAFYKYRNRIFLYEDKLTQKIVNLMITLRDEAGVLSSVLTSLSEMHANILTLNQSIPVDGVAAVTISLRMRRDETNPFTITRRILQLPGVVDVRILSGE